ncbi:amidohydrolase family protein [Lacimicrobium sp. SS2-24]|uniref:N-acyl-D-amino-acid deacylase family protein n=1 Tax=Lacimicrobium sp. SS2-24 TaxID=2005569 RepID=UPI0014394C2E|nr:amidohydrolase family protein [Lacimicrobium sp. SS2-24]
MGQLTKHYLLLFLGVMWAMSWSVMAKQVDWLIQSDRIYTGDRQGPYQGVVVIDKGLITHVGPHLPENIHPLESIDATGLVVSAGFIDPHTHACRDFNGGPGNLNANYLTQGVTSVFCNNDGGGPADVVTQMSRYQRQGVGTNVALYVGHNSVRKAVIGMANRPPTEAELEQMREKVALAMKHGAMGLSSGLYYVPGSYAQINEVIALAEVVQQYGGHYDSHIRDESSYSVGLLASVNEVITVAEQAGIAANISHIKALGVDVWGQSKEVVALINQARERGLRITADQYPWLASGSSITAALIPAWARADGHEALIRRLEDPAHHKTIKAQVQDNLRRRGGADALLFTDATMPQYQGKTLKQLALESQRSAVDMAIAIVKEGKGDGVASFNMQQQDVKHFMMQDWTMTSSDGSSGHPRKYASFPRKYTQYVKENSVLSLEGFLYRSSTLAAQTFALGKRGKLKNGYVADVVIFDPARFAARATYLQPQQHSSGVEWLWVNGQAAVARGKVTGIKAGQVIKRSANALAQ